MITFNFIKTARALRLPRSGLFNSSSQITYKNNMEKKRENSEAPSSAKRAKAENGEASKPSASHAKKETAPVPDLEECGFVEENLPQVSLFKGLIFSRAPLI
jgi:hypothetical protein